MMMRPGLAALALAQLAACGLERSPISEEGEVPPIEGQHAPSPTPAPAQCAAGGVPCGGPRFVGYLVDGCHWQAYPWIELRGERHFLDTFLSRERPAPGGVPAACNDRPLTSSTLLHAAICKGLAPCQSILYGGMPYAILGSYERVTLCEPVSRTEPPRCGSASAFIPFSVRVSTALPAPLVHYRWTTELGYHELSLDEHELYYAFFEDRTGKCAGWVKQQPCWSEEDLQIHSTLPLPAGTAQSTLDTLAKVGFFGLAAGSYGGASTAQRYYDAELTARGPVGEHRVAYESFPGAQPMPPALEDGIKLLHWLACNKLGRDLDGPPPVGGWSCP
jgi:hypothetical protein